LVGRNPWSLPKVRLKGSLLEHDRTRPQLDRQDRRCHDLRVDRGAVAQLHIACGRERVEARSVMTCRRAGPERSQMLSAEAENLRRARLGVWEYEGGGLGPRHPAAEDAPAATPPAAASAPKEQLRTSV
jgi:hypothetical protein